MEQARHTVESGVSQIIRETVKRIEMRRRDPEQAILLCETYLGLRDGQQHPYRYIALNVSNTSLEHVRQVIMAISSHPYWLDVKRQAETGEGPADVESCLAPLRAATVLLEASAPCSAADIEGRLLQAGLIAPQPGMSIEAVIACAIALGVMRPPHTFQVNKRRMVLPPALAPELRTRGNPLYLKNANQTSMYGQLALSRTPAKSRKGPVVSRALMRCRSTTLVSIESFQLQEGALTELDKQHVAGLLAVDENCTWYGLGRYFSLLAPLKSRLALMTARLLRTLGPVDFEDGMAALLRILNEGPTVGLIDQVPLEPCLEYLERWELARKEGRRLIAGPALAKVSVPVKKLEVDKAIRDALALSPGMVTRTELSQGAAAILHESPASLQRQVKLCPILVNVGRSYRLCQQVD